MALWPGNRVEKLAFDSKFLKEQVYDIPIIGVGNITVGGISKTPCGIHSQQSCLRLQFGCLEPGIQAQDKGLCARQRKSTPDLIGDEPYQIYQKFGVKVQVAVCENRRKGITELMRIFPDLQLIVLDDSFQHRWVKPKVSVLLTDYSRPFYKDRLLPLGRLRESPAQVNRIRHGGGYEVSRRPYAYQLQDSNERPRPDEIPETFLLPL